MKGVLVSEKPIMCEKIIVGKKTIIVKKSAPKQVPFKCYIYCTKAKEDRYILERHENGFATRLDGKVIGEFVCDRIIELEGEYWDDDTYESIGVVCYDEDDGERDVIIFVDNGCDNYKANILCRESCATWEELRRYIGTGINTFYAWHISDLKIYDKPKELREFSRPCSYSGLCFSCKRASFNEDGNLLCNTEITRLSQSWLYVEE